MAARAVTPAPDVTREGLQFFHRNQLDFSLARDRGQRLQVQFLISGDHRHRETATVAARHQGFEDLLRGQPDLCRYRFRSQVVRIHLVFPQLIVDPHLVEQPCCIGFLRHDAIVRGVTRARGPREPKAESRCIVSPASLLTVRIRVQPSRLCERPPTDDERLGFSTKESHAMRLLLNWVLSALAVWIVSHVVPGISVSGPLAALIAALAIGFINATIGLLLKVLTFPLTLLTLGLFWFVINAAMLKLASALVPGFEVRGFWAAFIGAIVLSLVSSLLHWLVKPSAKRQ